MRSRRPSFARMRFTCVFTVVSSIGSPLRGARPAHDPGGALRAGRDRARGVPRAPRQPRLVTCRRRPPRDRARRPADAGAQPPAAATLRAFWNPLDEPGTAASDGPNRVENEFVTKDT